MCGIVRACVFVNKHYVVSRLLQVCPCMYINNQHISQSLVLCVKYRSLRMAMYNISLCVARHTVKHEYSLVKQHLDSVGQLNKATCRVLSSQVAG